MNVELYVGEIRQKRGSTCVPELYLRGKPCLDRIRSFWFFLSPIFLADAMAHTSSKLTQSSLLGLLSFWGLHHQFPGVHSDGAFWFK